MKGFWITWNNLIVLSLIQCSNMTLAQLSRNTLYRSKMVDEQWWLNAKLPNASYADGSLVSCAGRCLNHGKCDLFSLEGDGSLCHLGTGRTSNTFPVSDNENSKLQTKVYYSKQTGSCEQAEGISYLEAFLVFTLQKSAKSSI